MKWPIYKINDICKVSGGKRLPKGHQFVDSKTKHPYIRITDMSFDSLSTDALLYITEETFKHISRYTISKDDIYISIAGTIGYVGKIPEFIDGANLTENCAKLSEFSDEINMDYLLYYLRSPRGNGELLVRKGGASQPKLALERIKTVPVPVPPINIQSRIANILSAYDDLIENNQKQIKLLEEAAMWLYKEWFVKLRFPGHENTKIVDGVPEGWEYKEVGSLISKTPRTKQVKKSEYKNSGEIPIIDQSREFIAGYTDDRETIVDLGVPVIVFGDHTRILKLINFPFAKGADGTQLIVSGLEEMPQHLLYCSLLNIDLSNYHYARHFKYLKASKIIVPTKNISEEFESIVEIYFKVIQILRDKIFLLQKSRDFLLPKLMNGEIEV